MRARQAGVAIGCALTLVLAGCTSSVDGTGTATATSSASVTSSATSDSAPSTTSSSSTAASTTTSSSTAASIDAPESLNFPGNPDVIPWTSPSTSLAFGEPATVGLQQADARGVFTVVVTDATKGTDADWATLGFDAAPLPGTTPLYVHVTATQLSGDSFVGYRPEAPLNAFTVDDEAMKRREVRTVDNPLCQNVPAPADFTIGSTHESCILFAEPADDPFDTVEFIGPNPPEDSVYLGDPISWQ